MDKIAEIAGKLTEAQRDIMMGHMVEIPPQDAEQLEVWGLKEPQRKITETITRTIWPITQRGLAVRNYLNGE